MAQPTADGLDHLIAFLQKREGIDKTLKLIRYTSRLVAATSPHDSERFKRASALEKSVGVSRKAYRLGKFLQDVNHLRKSRATGWPAVMELAAYGGEGVYYFIEQLVWLVKAGVLDKASEQQLGTISAVAELVGYVASIWLSLLKIRELRQSIADAEVAVAKLAQEEGCRVDAVGASTSSAPIAMVPLDGPWPVPSPGLLAQQRKLAKLQVAHRTKALAIVQDLADSLLAVNDLRGGRDKVLGHPATLAICGLVSGLVSAHKNWNAV